ncbi:MAG: ABC-F family ATP-binding cassette domain-containing protein [Alphaproteobacteria bacterium]|nr:ABC-F family ATP-binding cassette domain-containing protein [Alphaproteobacteria bacterium]
MLHINDLTYRIGGRVIIDQATVVLPKGHKAGLIGRNGSGKTTLFNLISGDLSLDDGEIRLRTGMQMGRVSQETPEGTHSLLQEVMAADKEMNDLLAEAETATDPHRIADIHIRLSDIDAHSAEARAGAILSGLGFDAEAQQRAVNDFSGGWRMRVALAATLFLKPDFLLLDEPTNHLDLEASLWLENYLSNYQGTILVISHERSFLNTVVNEIIHLEHGKLTRYGGGYDFFEKTRREKLELQSKMYAKQQAERKHIQSFIDRFRAQANKASQAQSRIKALARMEPIASVMEERTTTFSFPNPTTLSPPLITLDETTVGYEPGKPILSNMNLYVDMEDRIGLLGANGNGKSTMIKLLGNRLQPQEGQVRKSGKLKTAYFAQHQTDELNVTETPFYHMAQLMEGVPIHKVRAHLGRFGFGADKADVEVGKLSGGEKARLLFALMSRENPHIMLLDEPTNHLDVDSREALIRALNDYEGAVILVSHDRHLLELVCDRLWVVEDGTCVQFDGDMNDYSKRLLEKRKANGGGKNKNKPEKQEGKSNRKEGRKERAAARAAQAPLRKAVKEAEKQMEILGAKKEKLKTALADPEIYEDETGKATKLQRELGELEKKIENAEETWLEAQEILAAAS